MRVYIIEHKKVDLPKLSDIYAELQVGAAINGKIDSVDYYDNDGENISDKNISYNELTGLYWIWKNSNEDIIGLCHYRRFFVDAKAKIMNVIFGEKGGYISEKKIRKKLQHSDMIVHNKTYYSSSNKEQFEKTQKYPNDLDIVEKVIDEYYPDYSDAYKKVVYGKNSHLLNMMIARKQIVDEYCEWLFGVLFKVEDTLQKNGETEFQRRIGMLGERLLDVWIEKNNIKVCEMFSINTERRDCSIIAG